MNHSAQLIHRHEAHRHARPLGGGGTKELQRENHRGAISGAGAHATWIAFTATLHCLTGCAVGEVLGMVIGTAVGLDNSSTTALAIVLAFVFGYLLTIQPLLRSGMPRGAAVRLALAADTASITLMEIVDNAIMWMIPGAMDAGLDTRLFWGSLTVSLLVAGLAAWPLNRWLITRGRGHAVVHSSHRHRDGG